MTVKKGKSLIQHELKTAQRQHENLQESASLKKSQVKDMII